MLMQLHHGFGRAHSASIVLMILLCSTIALNVSTLFFLHDIDVPMLVSGNVVLLGATFMSWLALQKYMLRHRRLLHWYSPIQPHLLNHWRR
jgi:hypothetical protein